MVFRFSFVKTAFAHWYNYAYESQLQQALLCSIELGSVQSLQCDSNRPIRLPGGKSGNRNHETAKIGIHTPPKSDIYFRFAFLSSLTAVAFVMRKLLKVVLLQVGQWAKYNKAKRTANGL